MTLIEKYQPSESCTCEICQGYCKRPGWWTVEEAKKVIDSEFVFRMMLELAPKKNFGVLSPAFKGNECNYSLQVFAGHGCTFLKDGLCELYETGLQPLKCHYCHHTRTGSGKECHLAIEKEWNNNYARRLIVRWGNKTGFWRQQGLLLIENQQ